MAPFRARSPHARSALLGAAIGLAACDTSGAAAGWIKLEPLQSAGPKEGHGMAYDARSRRVVLFGGRTGGEETWAFDPCARQWEEQHPANRPPARAWPAMAYDARSDRVILFGGGADDAALPPPETWAYDVDS